MSTRLSQHHYQPVRRDEGPRTITSPALILSKQILQGKEEFVCLRVCMGGRVHSQVFKSTLNKRTISDGPIFCGIPQTKQGAIKFLLILLIPIMSYWDVLISDLGMSYSKPC